jgi:hypothetical protein
MATFYSGLLALGTGSGSTFVEMVGSGYAQKAVNFGTPDQSGRSLCLSVASWTPGVAWPGVTQLAVVDVSGAVLVVLNFENAITFVTSAANTIAAGRLSFALPLPAFSANLQGGGSGNTGEIGGSATVGHVGLGADTVILTPAAAIANLLAGG